jgi:hypothetical protein
VLICTSSGLIFVYSSSEYKFVNVFVNQFPRVYSIIFSDEDNFYTGGRDPYIRKWSLVHHKQLDEIDSENGSIRKMLKFEKMIYAYGSSQSIVRIPVDENIVDLKRSFDFPITAVKILKTNEEENKNKIAVSL